VIIIDAPVNQDRRRCTCCTYVEVEFSK